jgi:putative acetyltransferase
MVEIVIANNEKEYEAAAILFKEYAAWLNIDLGFQKFDEELLQLQKMYSFPNGAILLSKEENIFTGCVAVRKKENGIAELKRMFIKTQYRKEGIGALLLQRALELAKELHYKKIRLDTLDTMTPAIKLYKKYGFYEIEPYYFNPEKNAVFFEKSL